jgi:hypothetical protein
MFHPSPHRTIYEPTSGNFAPERKTRSRSRFGCLSQYIIINIPGAGVGEVLKAFFFFFSLGFYRALILGGTASQDPCSKEDESMMDGMAVGNERWWGGGGF